MSTWLEFVPSSSKMFQTKSTCGAFELGHPAWTSWKGCVGRDGVVHTQTVTPRPGRPERGSTPFVFGALTETSEPLEPSEHRKEGPPHVHLLHDFLLDNMTSTLYTEFCTFANK